MIDFSLFLTLISSSVLVLTAWLTVMYNGSVLVRA